MDRCRRLPLTPPQMTIASIDIGTNTILLLIADVDTDGQITVRTEEQRIPRLGRGVDKRGVLGEDAMTRAIRALKEYVRIIRKCGVDTTIVCGTSALRDAANRGRFIDRVGKETGLTVEVLSGDEEAEWTYKGAISGVQGVGRGTVVDIGGGSTEISLGDARHVEKKISLPLGSVRLTEKAFLHDPPSGVELESAIEIVEQSLQHAPTFAGSTLIGVAGTATSLAILAQGLPDFDMRAVTGFRLRRDRVEELFQMLSTLPSARVRSLSSVMQGRHDIILAGTLILREIMFHFGFDELIVSERGVRYGLVLREWARREREAGPKDAPVSDEPSSDR